MGLVITPLPTPRRFDPLTQPLQTSQKLGGRELVWRFDGGDITTDGGALVLKKLEERTGILRRFAPRFRRCWKRASGGSTPHGSTGQLSRMAELIVFSNNQW